MIFFTDKMHLRALILIHHEQRQKMLFTLKHVTYSIVLYSASHREQKKECPIISASIPRHSNYDRSLLISISN
jgi:hypothetical protein